jgi:D-arginine dehydrogenase
MTEKYDMILIGAGIAGASIASFLPPKCRVLLLEAERSAGYHATGRSAALYAATYGPPAIRSLNRASRRFFDQPPPGFAASPLLKPRGALFVGGHGQREAVLGLQEEQVREGGNPQLLDAQAACALVPVLDADKLDAALHDPCASDIEVDLLLQGFLRTARANGATVQLGDALVALEPHGDGWQVATASGKVCQAAVVVNCAGAWVDQVAALAGLPGIGIEPRRRSAFLFEPPQGVDCTLWPAVIAADESWYFKPDAGLLLGSPANADPVVPHDVVAEELDVATGIYRIEGMTSLQIRGPTHTWAGLRSFVADGEPVCGYDEAAPGFFWAAALGGYGIQTAPAFGALCASLLTGDGVPADIADQGLAMSQLSPHRSSLPGRNPPRPT